MIWRRGNYSENTTEMILGQIKFRRTFSVVRRRNGERGSKSCGARLHKRGDLRARSGAFVLGYPQRGRLAL